ncbi:MAG: gamma-glutamyltransferase [Gammaproteobacteria bacterium]|nr:gamma-glutamyltransferase [Gammaproteobacteria bacterium]MXW44778.1 gamma-glutamyltransferase [Gammaproteobacteria bacterium]MYD01018.1 gamma-glutamyltransferase [Gammaproteobacteria bacterium]MYI23974.1 gamma-glutamyltransferase [Gammaproteobacteria bacterium]
MKLILPRAGQFLLPALLLWIAAAGGAHAEDGMGKVARATGPGHAAIASAHPAATAAGFEILSRGGNAFDAAVAVSAALSVAEPHSSGIGGGGFFLLHRAADESSVFVDGRETAPGAATRDMYLDENGEPVRRASLSGPLAAGIPGLPAALEHIANQYGRLPLEQSLAPAIRLAREGLPVTEGTQRLLRAFPRMGSPSPAFVEMFMPGGETPPVGEMIRRPDLADTLAILSSEGAAGFYTGPRAELLVTGVRDAGGIWSMEDLAAYRIIERQPVRFDYGGVEVTTAPPPSAGGVALAQVFNMLRHRGYAQLEDPARTHLLVEAIRRAYRDRAEYLGDPDFVPVPVERLIHPWYADGLLASVRMDRATPSDTLPGPVSQRPLGTDTSHFSVLDKDGNRAAVTQTINTLFGSGFVPPGTGVILNNEMDDFSVKRGAPNAFGLVHSHANGIEPGKRMLSSMTPTFLESGRGLAILGTPGGSRIVTMVLLGALAWMEGADAEGIVSLPRVHHQYIPDSVSFEAGAMDEDLQAALAELGHELRESSRPWGNMQAITLEYADATLTAASDPRRNGGSDVR